MKENQHATKCSLLVEKQKDFSKTVLIRSLRNILEGTVGVAQSIELQHFMATKTESYSFFILLQVTLLVLQVTLLA